MTLIMQHCLLYVVTIFLQHAFWLVMVTVLLISLSLHIVTHDEHHTHCKTSPEMVCRIPSENVCVTCDRICAICAMRVFSTSGQKS